MLKEREAGASTGYTDLVPLLDNLKGVPPEEAEIAVITFNSRTALYDNFLLYHVDNPNSRIAVMNVQASLNHGCVLLRYTETRERTKTPTLIKISKVSSLFGQ